MEKCDLCQEWFQHPVEVTRIIVNDRVCLKCEGRSERDAELASLRAQLSALEEHFELIEDTAEFCAHHGINLRGWLAKARAILGEE